MKLLRECTIILGIGYAIIMLTLTWWITENDEDITKLEQYKTSTEKVISRLHDESRGHTDEIKELRIMIDELINFANEGEAK